MTTKKTREEKFLEVKRKLETEKVEYKSAYVRRHLGEKDNLRKVFLAVLKTNPALIHEISQNALLSKPTCYDQLHKLMDLGLISRKYVEEAEKSKDKEILNKFEDWTSKMPPNLKRYFRAKASFFKITDTGKDFVEWAYKKHREYQQKVMED